MPDDGTLLTMTTPLPAGTLEPVALRVDEAISMPFMIWVQMVSRETDIDANQLLHHPACVTLHRELSEDRYFHGIVRSFTSGEWRENGLHYFEAEIVPKWWFASQTVDCRVFHKVTVENILTTLLDDNGITDREFKLYGERTPREFTVQFNESDADFATRLMEEEGYYYFFRHTESAHTLVITNANTGFSSLAVADMELTPEGAGIRGIHSWHRMSATAVGKVSLKDYDPLKPSTSVAGNQSTILTAAGASQREVFQWPALTTDPGQASSRARLRQEAAEAFAALVQGVGQNHLFVPGAKFNLLEGPVVTADAGEYVVRSVTHEATDETHATGGGGNAYSNQFTAFPAATTWRQTLSVPRPSMAGIYSAVVVGPDGEEIHTDEYGRVKVRFHWDHRAEANAGNTIWLRVMQPWSGKNWGMQTIPRVGSEVAVAFVDADLDHPIVIGSLYNGEQMHPLSPADKVKTGIRTRSYPGGGTEDYNEISMDDTAGAEVFLVHAQYDHVVEVEHDQTITVGNDRKLTVKVDETVKVEGNQTVTVSKKRSVEVSQDDDLLNVKMGKLATTVDMGDVTTTAKLGNITVEASVGAIKLSALQSIELVCGPTTSVKLTPQGVEIKGMMITVDGAMKTEVKGLMTDVSGTAMLKLGGGITMIG